MRLRRKRYTQELGLWYVFCYLFILCIMYFLLLLQHARWLTDLSEFNEWMNELDYEPAEGEGRLFMY